MKRNLIDEEIESLPAQPLMPITSKDLIPTPWKKKDETPDYYKNSTKTQQIATWARRYDAVQKLPTTDFEKIRRLEIGDLRTLASLFWAYNKEQMLKYTKDELLVFILGHRQDKTQYRPLVPPTCVSLIDL